MCDPKSSGWSDASLPARRPMMFPAKSMLGSSFAARIHSITFARAALSASLYATRDTPPSGFLPNSLERGEMRVDALGVDAEVSLNRVDRQTGGPVDRKAVSRVAEKRRGRAA